MRINRTIIVAVALFVANVSIAQKAYIQGGINFANITKTNDGQTEDNNTLTSFNVGIMGGLGLSKNLDIETGLLLTGKGAKAETYFNGGNDYIKAKFNPLYVELPINLIAKVPISNGSNIFFYGGPYVAMGVAGKSKTESKLGIISSSSSENIKFNDDDPTTSQQEDAAYNKLKRFDFGANVGVGISFKSIFIKANYGIGLAKINSTADNNTSNDKNKFRTFSLSLGIPLN